MNALHMINALFVAQTQQNPSPQTGWRNMFNRSFYDNELWRFAILLLIILVTMILSKVVKIILEKRAKKKELQIGANLWSLFLRCISGPVVVAICAAGVYIARMSFRFADDTDKTGFSKASYDLWGQIASATAALAVAYFLYRLVDILEHYLKLWASRTEEGVAEMLIPVLRRTIKIFIIAVSLLFIADNILGADITTIIAAAGVGGLAVALAAQETIANFFGSITIFADRPFKVGERIRVGSFDGPIEEVGFRSTRIRTLEGHQVSIPNSKITNEMLENIGRRPFIRRLANISITYDTPPDKVQKAVQIIKDILAKIPDINQDPDLPPRVYFNDFKDYYLNILMIYWFKPPNYWDYQQCSQQINIDIMQAFQTENIEFAFPTQTLHLKNEDTGLMK